MSSPQDGTTEEASKQDQYLKVNNHTLTKEQQEVLLRSFLPACQPQEGSPANTFTHSELDDLQRAVGNIQVGPRSSSSSSSKNNSPDDDDAAAATDAKSMTESATRHSRRTSSNSKMDLMELQSSFQGPPVIEAPLSFLSPVTSSSLPSSLDWHGSPRFHKDAHLAQAFREQVRRGTFTSPTNGICPGFLQCNLVVLPQGPVAFDFLLFCQRNPKACPLIEVCDVGSPFAHGVAPGADLRTDCPKYAIYRNGKLDSEVTDVTDLWPKDSVAFLVGCSFSYDGALMDAGIRLKSAEQGKNVPMYRTNLKCRPAGSLSGNMVVSMKPISALLVSKHIEITCKYTHAHGGPVAVGSSSAIGIKDIDSPEWGDAVDVAYDEVPIFHACGVTPQCILMDSKVPFAITHSAGHMFVTDLPSDLGV